MNKKFGGNTLSYIIAFILFIIVCYKAITLSMTHDESASYFYLNHVNITTYLFDGSVWPNANNHWLNTLGFQLTSRIFGPQEWAIRLPNILAFIIYAYYSIRLLNDVKSSSFRILGLLIILANPYVLDFFSTARGYGLSLAFTTMALHYVNGFIKKEYLQHLIISLILLLLATLSLFSSLIYVPALMGGVLLYLLFTNSFKANSRSFIIPVFVIAAASIITLIITYKPLKALSGNEEFKWGASTLMECFESLALHSSYANKFIPNNHFIVGILSCFLLFSIIKSFPLFCSLKSIRSNSVLLLGITTFVFLLIGIVVARYTVGTYYPIERKTIMFIPFIGIITAYTLDNITVNYKNYLGWILSLMLTAHFILSFDKNQVREWWYDRDTKDFITQISQDAASNKVVLGCNWLFHPTLSFYAQTKFPNQIEIMGYNKEIDVKKDFDYYMCFSSDYDQLKEKYEILYSNPTGRMILKLKK